MTWRVLVKPSGISFTVHEDETILDAALRHGYFFPHQCRIGICGTCMGQVLAGEIDYAGKEIMALVPNLQEQGYVLFCCAQARSDLVIYVKDFASTQLSSMQECEYEVTQLELLTENITRIFLQATTAEHLFYQAGQYIKIVHPDGTLSPLSIANAPQENNNIELHLAHPASNQVAQEILRQAREEKKILLRGAFGSCTVGEIYTERPIIFLARGTGFAPIKAIIEDMARFQKYPRIHLYWSVTSPKELYLQDLLQKWVKKLNHFSFTPVLSRAYSQWQGRTGLLQQIVLEDYPDVANYLVYASAPEAIVHDVLHALQSAGLPRERYYSDVFD